MMIPTEVAARIADAGKTARPRPTCRYRVVANSSPAVTAKKHTPTTTPAVNDRLRKRV